MEKLETLILAHRYLYYVKNTPVLSDYEYDLLEKAAKKTLSQESRVHQVGSDLASDYPDEVRQAAMKLLA